MQELVQIFKKQGQEFVNDLFSDYLVVTEKLSGSSFSFEVENNKFTFFKGNGQRPINLVDRTLMVYYEPAINYIQSTKKSVISKIPDNWRFCFEYFVHNEPGVIKYDKLPKNNLVLTHIQVKGPNGKIAKIIEDPRVIKDWADMLNVTALIPIFKGYLNSEQKNKIREFITLSVEDQEELFGTKSFATYIINTLNPTVSETLLQNDLTKPIDSIIFKFYKTGSTNVYAAKLIDPFTKNLMKEREPFDLRRAPADINEIILLDILAFIEERGLRKHDILSTDPDKRYIELISNIFNDYVARRGDDIKNLNFEKADFVKGDEFDLNVDMISNQKTRELLKDSSSLQNLYKIMLGSLRKKRNPDKVGSVLTPTVIEDFNKLITNIEEMVNIPNDGSFKTFNDYLELKKTNESLFNQEPLEDMIIAEKTLSFNEFLSHTKIDLNEALKVPYPNRGKMPVNIFVGRFQPFTLGHVKVFEEMYKENGLPTVVFLVRAAKPDPEKRPFDEDIQQAMFAKLAKEYPRYLQACFVVPNGGIDTLFAAARPAYEPILWGYGSDRKKGYDSMIDNPKYREELDVEPNFKGYEIKRGDEDISASKVRQALIIDDKSTFDKMTPKSIHDFYKALQDILIPIKESEDTNNHFDSYITEANTSKVKQEWINLYVKSSHTKNYVNPKSFEILRADFGTNDGAAEKAIITFLDKYGKIKPNTYTISQIAPKQFDNDVRSQISGEYTSYKLNFTADCTDVTGTTWTKGQYLIITNKHSVNKSGVSSVIGKKDLTPDKMGLSSYEYKSSSELIERAKTYVNTLSYPDNYKEFIISSSLELMNNKANYHAYDNLDSYANSSTAIIYNIDNSLFEGIDEISINNFQNDYGEVLGGLMLFNILKSTGTGLRYPTASNERMVDFYFDDYKISSKAGSGGTPSGDTLITSIWNEVHRGNLSLTGIAETDFYEYLVKPWVNPTKYDSRSSIYNIVMTLADTQLGSSKNSGYTYLLNYAKIQPSNATRESLLKFMDELVNDKDKFTKFINEFTTLTQFSTSRFDSETYRLDYISKRDVNNSDRIGLMFYPITVEVVKILNSKYEDVLTILGQKISDIKQVYLDVSIKRGTFTFLTKPFSTSNFIFEQKGSMNNPFNANIGIKIKK
jgi:hypothetical protein